MTSSTWSSDCGLALRGAGVDAETVARFDTQGSGGNPLPAVFSPRESGHCLGLANPAAGYCAAFCCKEAFFKAVDRPFSPHECELLLDPAAERHSVLLGPEVREECGVEAAEAHVAFSEGECVVVVHVFSRSPEDR